jgi:hypothetical protein
MLAIFSEVNVLFSYHLEGLFTLNRECQSKQKIVRGICFVRCRALPFTALPSPHSMSQEVTSDGNKCLSEHPVIAVSNGHFCMSTPVSKPLKILLVHEMTAPAEQLHSTGHNQWIFSAFVHIKDKGKYLLQCSIFQNCKQTRDQLGYADSRPPFLRTRRQVMSTRSAHVSLLFQLVILALFWDEPHSEVWSARGECEITA